MGTVDQIEQHLREVAEAGYAVNVGESAGNAAALGVVVRNRAQSPVAGLAVAAPVGRMPATRIPGIVVRMNRDSHAIIDAFTASVVA